MTNFNKTHQQKHSIDSAVVDSRSVRGMTNFNKTHQQKHSIESAVVDSKSVRGMTNFNKTHQQKHSVDSVVVVSKSAATTTLGSRQQIFFTIQVSAVGRLSVCLHIAVFSTIISFDCQKVYLFGFHACK